MGLQYGGLVLSSERYVPDEGVAAELMPGRFGDSGPAGGLAH